MEIRQLEYFVCVVETNSFTKAAEKQYVSQPCITHSIHKLEEELGFELFDRSQKKSPLTDEGKRFYLRACKLLNELRDTMTEMNELRNLSRGTINLAIPPMIGSCLFPYLFTSFQTKYPHLTLNVCEEGSFSAHRMIEQEELDLGIWRLSNPFNLPSRKSCLPLHRPIHWPNVNQCVSLIYDRKNSSCSKATFFSGMRF